MWELTQLQMVVERFANSFAPSTIPFFAYCKNEVFSGILCKRQMQRERLFKRLQNFVRHALADAILALNLPLIQCSIQPMRCTGTDENDQMFRCISLVEWSIE